MNSRYIFKGLCLAGMTLGLAACQNDEIEPVTVSTTDGSAITLNCVIGSTVESRAMIQLGNQDESAEYFLWNEGDVLWVKNLGSEGTNTDGETYKFEISSDYSDENPSNTASFICMDSTVTISEGDVLCAVYAGSEATEYTTSFILGDDGFGSWYFDTYSDSEVEEYFKKNMYMYAKVTYSSSNTPLSFEHLTSMIRVSYVNDTKEEQQISYLNLTGTNDIWLGYGLSLDEVEGTYSCTSATNALWNDFTDLTVESGDTIDFYTLFFPNASTEFSEDSFFEISSDGGELMFKSSDFTGATNFVTGYRYWFDVTMTDDGLEWTNYEVSAYDEYIEILSETNAALNKYLANILSGAYLDDDGNLWIPTEVVEATTELTISYDYDIVSLDGLERFTNLESLSVEKTSITSLDCSCFPNLYYLDCAENSLTSLVVSRNTSLMYLFCGSNNLTSLDLSNNTILTRLVCQNIGLTSLDLSNNTILARLECHSNRLTSLDLSANTALEYLFCDNNQLTSLDLSNNTILSSLMCSHNELTSLDLSNNTILNFLDCYGNQLTSLDLSNNTALEYLYCYNNQLTSLDLSNNTILTTLRCSFNNLTSLDLSHNIALVEIECQFNENLMELICSGGRLALLDFAGDTSLTTLKVDGNCLNALDICDLSDLTELTCGNQKDYWSGEEQTLTLSLYESQATWWYDNYEWLSENYNVELNVVE